MFTLCIHRPTMYYKTPDRNVKNFYIFKCRTPKCDKRHPIHVQCLPKCIMMNRLLLVVLTSFFK